MKFSVLIPFYNHHNQIEKVVAAILNEPQFVDEILVCVDGCECPDLSRFGMVRILKSPKNLGLAPTRNILLKEARSEYVLFLDADCILEERSLEATVQKWDGQSFFAGRESDSPKDGLANQFRAHFWVQTLGQAPLSSAPYLMGLANGGLRQKFLECGLFCDQMGNYGEDIEFSKRALKMGYNIQYLSDLKVFHDRHDNFASLIKMVKSHCKGQIIGHFLHGCPIIDIYKMSLGWIVIATGSSLRRHRSLPLALVSLTVTTSALLFRCWFAFECYRGKHAIA